ncbi:MAG: Gfo/Idh/MocA family oxidoreductase, partial [Chloroflexota bacterium]|nr:Gfo/Idh/MocA family oxidoreductase [Chloroflexota bacterium]
MGLRVGIVGTGFGARVQIPGFRAAGYEVTAICSARLDRARAAAEQAGIPVAVDMVGDLVARDDVDVVCVTSPPTLHREHALAALAAGKHVICEKPMARDTGEAREMLAAAERAGVVHAIDH